MENLNHRRCSLLRETVRSCTFLGTRCVQRENRLLCPDYFIRPDRPDRPEERDQPSPARQSRLPPATILWSTDRYQPARSSPNSCYEDLREITEKPRARRVACGERKDIPSVTLSICGERPTPNAVCTSSGLHSLRPCLEQGAAQVKRPSWQTQGGRVRSLALLNSLQK
jgi:hypothetical protein